MARERERRREKRRKGEAVIPRKEKIVDIFIVYKVHVYARNCLPVRSLSPLGEVGRPLGERSRGRRPPLALPVSSGVQSCASSLCGHCFERSFQGSPPCLHELSHKIAPDRSGMRMESLDGYLVKRYSPLFLSPPTNNNLSRNPYYYSIFLSFFLTIVILSNPMLKFLVEI